MCFRTKLQQLARLPLHPALEPFPQSGWRLAPPYSPSSAKMVSQSVVPAHPLVTHIVDTLIERSKWLATTPKNVLFIGSSAYSAEFWKKWMSAQAAAADGDDESSSLWVLDPSRRLGVDGTRGDDGLELEEAILHFGQSRLEAGAGVGSEAEGGVGVVDAVFLCGMLNWHPQPDRLLLAASSLLRPSSLFAAATFGSESLWELRDCLQEATMNQLGGVAMHVPPTLDPAALAGAMSMSLTSPTLDFERHSTLSPSLSHIFADLQIMGERNSLKSRPGFIRRSVLQEAESIYRERYGLRHGEVDTGLATTPEEEGAPAPSSAATSSSSAVPVDLPCTFDVHFLSAFAPDGIRREKERASGEISLASVLGGDEAAGKNGGSV